MTNVQLNWN